MHMHAHKQTLYCNWRNLGLMSTNEQLASNSDIAMLLIPRMMHLQSQRGCRTLYPEYQAMDVAILRQFSIGHVILSCIHMHQTLLAQESKSFSQLKSYPGFSMRSTILKTQTSILALITSQNGSSCVGYMCRYSHICTHTHAHAHAHTHTHTHVHVI